MFLHKVHIKNFRGINELTIVLDDTCVLIGENNSGKTTILDAIRVCLTRNLGRGWPIFDEYDHHLDASSADPSKTDPIEIVLDFSEREEDEWPSEVSQWLAEAVQINDGLQCVRFRVQSIYESSISNFSTSWDFLDLAGNSLNKAKNPSLLNNLRQCVPTFYLDSLRDAAQEFRPRSPFWGPFLRSLELDDQTRKEFENSLSILNQKILDQHVELKTVMKHLEKTTGMLPLGQNVPVTIVALPSKVFDILSKTQVNLESISGARIPVIRHGHGTQSLAVISLFEAFLESQISKENGQHADPLLTLEEPEAHLHPSAIKATGELLQKLSGQKIISTHSGDILASVPLKKLRRLRRKDGVISVFYLKDNELTDDEVRKLDYQIRSHRGSLFFSRCWLLVEGETDAIFMNEFGRVLGYDLYSEGVSCIEYSQVGVEKFIKLADALGIEWFVLADNDREGEKYISSAESQLRNRSKDSHMKILDHGNLEVFLCMEGFGRIYEQNIAEQKENNITAEINTKEYWEQVINAQRRSSKSKTAITVTEEIGKLANRRVPFLLNDVIDRSLKLARGAV